MIELAEKELYQEVDIIVDGAKIGFAEIELNSKNLSRLHINEPYQNKGYGTQIVKMLVEKYGCEIIWVDADNARAIHVYEKNGFVKSEPTVYLMKYNPLACLRTGDERE